MLFSNFNFCIILFYFILFKGEKKKTLIYVGRRLLSVFHMMENILCVYTEVIVTETKSWRWKNSNKYNRNTSKK